MPNLKEDEEVKRELRKLDHVINECENTIDRVKKEHARVWEFKRRTGKTLDEMAKHIDQLMNQWVEMTQKEQKALNQQFTCVTTALPSHSMGLLTLNEMEELKNRRQQLKNKVQGLLEADEEANEMKRKTKEDGKRLMVAEREAKFVEQKQLSLLGMLAPNKKDYQMTVEQAQRAVLWAVSYLEETEGKDSKLAKELKEFLNQVACESSSTQSGKNGEIPVASPSSSLVAMDSLTPSQMSAVMNSQMNNSGSSYSTSTGQPSTGSFKF